MAASLFTADLAKTGTGSLFVCCPGDDRIRMAGSLFTADIAKTGTGWQDLCFSAVMAMTGS